MAMLALLSGIWGASYLLIKYAVRDLSEPTVVFSRTALAALALLAFIRMRDRAAWSALADLRRRPGAAFLLGLTAIGAPFLLITYGERTVPSGLTAVLIASAPIFIAIFAPFLDRSEIMTPAQWGGLIVGLAGVGLLVGVEQIDTAGEFLGALAMIAAAASYGLSGFILKRSYPGYPPVVTSFFSIATSAAMTLPLVAIQPPSGVPGALAIFSVAVLGLFGTAYAFVVYYQLIGEVGFGRASVVAYTIPPVSLIYGSLLLDERITPAMVGGMLLILLGVSLIARARRAVVEAVSADRGPAGTVRVSRGNERVEQG
jgi:drug/metabolite transporter (DMT)-like permease